MKRIPEKAIRSVSFSLDKCSLLEILRDVSMTENQRDNVYSYVDRLENTFYATNNLTKD